MTKSISSINKCCAFLLSNLYERSLFTFNRDLEKKVNQIARSTLTNSRISGECMRSSVIFTRSYHTRSCNKFISTQNNLTKDDLASIRFVDDAKGIRSVKDILNIFDYIKNEKQTLHKKNQFWDKDGYQFHPLLPKVQFPFGIWTRGASNKYHRLTPSVFRTHEGYYDETSIIHVFQHIHAHHANFHSTNFEWQSLMEHYFVPTRLLNWTQNILVSLYFATDIEEDNKNEEDGAIWILNALRLNELATVLKGDRKGGGIAIPNSFNVKIRAEMALAIDVKQWISAMRFVKLNDYDSPQKDDFNKFLDDVDANKLDSWKDEWEKLFHPIAVSPRVLSERLKSQRGAFTLHSGKCYPSQQNAEVLERRLEEGSDLFELNKAYEEEMPFLRIVEIPKDSKTIIREELSYMGIHKGTIYPELEHHAKSIKKYFFYPTRRN